MQSITQVCNIAKTCLSYKQDTNVLVSTATAIINLIKNNLAVYSAVLQEGKTH